MQVAGRRNPITTTLVLVAMIAAFLPAFVLTAVPALAAGPGDIVISEIIQNPAAVADANGEWFEVFNSTGAAIDVEGWTISDNDTDSHVIANGGPLEVPAGGYLVLGVDGNSATNGGVSVDYVYSGVTLANGADELVLIDVSATEIDRVEWDDGATFPDPTGASMSLADVGSDNNVGANWCTASTPYGDGDFGTPGAANDCPPPLLPKVVINEIIQNPNEVSDAAGEWFEVFNPTGAAIDIDGWTISDNDTDSHVINNGGPLVVPAAGYLVLGNNADTGTNGGVSVDYEYSGIALANGDDELVLTDNSTNEIDRVEWDGGPAFPDPNGASMALADTALDNNVGANWCTASTPYGDGDFGTPGAANDCAALVVAELVINEIMPNTLAVSDDFGEWFEIFNPTVDPIDIDGWTISDDDIDSHTINNGGPLVVPAGGYLVLGRSADTGINGGVNVDYEYSGFFLSNSGDEVVLADSLANLVDRVTYFSASDVAGASNALIDPELDNSSVNANWCIASTPYGDGDLGTPGATNDCPLPEVVINEIIQNPAAVADALGEWFEVYNPGTAPVNIDGWVISDNGSDTHTISNGGVLDVPAGGYLVLGVNSDALTNGGVTVDYEYSSFTLANGDDEVVLTDQLGNEIDRVEYDGGPSFPDPTGASMSLANPSLDNNVAENWCEAATPFGDGDLGTPGANNDCILFIHDVQGSGSAVAISGPVIVQAVVTSLLETDDTLSGFLLQEEEGDYDADPATSEGIRVFCGSSCPAGLAVGDQVTVSGNAGEFFGMSEIAAFGGVTINSSGNLLPAATFLGLPAPAGTNVEGTFEELEGMLVEFTDELFVSEYFELARFGQIVLTVDERPYQFTHENDPSVTGYSTFLDDLAARRIVLDDNNDNQNDAISGLADEPYFYPEGGFSTTNYFRGGDSISGLTGVLDWSFGEWRVKPTPEVFDYTFTPNNPRTPSPDPVGGSLRVASFNVLNYFSTIDLTSSGDVGDCGPSGTLDCRGADSVDELNRQRDKTVAALAAIDADIVGLIEIENNEDASLIDLVGGLNAIVGSGTYDYVDTGHIGTDAIKVALIYKPATVAPVGSFAILDSSVDSSFIDTKNRPVLIQTFDEVASGSLFTVAVNHLKSKGSPCNDVGDLDLLDGAGNCNVTRTNAATALVDYLVTDPTDSGDPDFLIIGDLNSYAMEDPIDAIKAAGYTDLINLFGGSGAYSYVFDGQLGYLDHALANGALLPQVAGVTEWHINADEVPVFDYNDGVRDAGEASFERESTALPIYEPNAYRASDHDPVIIGLDLDAAFDLKVQAAESLGALLPTGDKKNDKRIEKAIERIEDSLNPEWWETDATLNAKNGNHVFDREKQAVQELMKVDDPDEAAAQAAIDLLVEADRLLAQIAINAAIADGGDQKRIEKANEQMAKAFENITDGEFDKAIGYFKKAWQEAIKAIK